MHWRDHDDPPSPAESALAAPFAGHLSMNAQMRAERREALVERLTPRIIRAERGTARVEGRDFSQRAQERRIAGESPASCATSSASAVSCTARSARRRRATARAVAAAAARTAAPRRARDRATAPPASARRRTWRRSRPASRAATRAPSVAGGAYRGKYQFDYGTWASVGGTGDPAAASEAEQDAPRGAALRAVGLRALARLRRLAR